MHERIVTAGATRNGDTLPRLETIAISNDFERRRRGITSAQQPTQIGGCPAKLRPLMGREKLPILSVRSAVLSLVRQRSISQAIFETPYSIMRIAQASTRPIERPKVGRRPKNK
jgi:hypothetical protein